jgi:hypothetical protein
MMARSAAASSAVSSLYGALIGAEGNRTAFHAADRGSARGPARRRVALRSLKACRLNHLWRGWLAGRAKMFLAFTRPQHPTGPATMLFPRPSRHRRNSDVSRFGRVELVPSRRLCRRQRGIPPFPSNAQTAGASGDASLYEALTLIGSDRLAGPASARTNVLRGYSAPYVPAPPPCFSRQTHSPRVWEATRPFSRRGCLLSRGKLGAVVATREQMPVPANRETIVRNFLSGQYSRPLRVVAFNIDEHWCRDVRHCGGGVGARLSADSELVSAGYLSRPAAHIGDHCGLRALTP